MERIKEIAKKIKMSESELSQALIVFNQSKESGVFDECSLMSLMEAVPLAAKTMLSAVGATDYSELRSMAKSGYLNFSSLDCTITELLKIVKEE